jgi:anti-sigma B factor antagonist
VAELDLQTEIVGDTAHVAVRGEVDVATTPQLRELLHGLVQDGVHHIVLDCTELAFLDSSGIGLLVATRKRLTDGELVIDSPQPHVRKVLELTGVNEQLSLRP